MTTPNNSCQWENRFEKQKIANKNRFNGARYGFRGTENWGPSDIVPQTQGMYPYPRGDDEQLGPVAGYEDPN